MLHSGMMKAEDDNDNVVEAALCSTAVFAAYTLPLSDMLSATDFVGPFGRFKQCFK